FSVLQLGRMVPRKGVDTVTEAIAVLRERYGVPAVLYVVGGNSRVPDAAVTPEIGRLARIAAELGIHDRVRFVGQRDRHELARYYSAANVFVTTPWYEPFGITPLEAMACAPPGGRDRRRRHPVQRGAWRNGFPGADARPGGGRWLPRAASSGPIPRPQDGRTRTCEGKGAVHLVERGRGPADGLSRCRSRAGGR